MRRHGWKILGGLALLFAIASLAGLVAAVVIVCRGAAFLHELNNTTFQRVEAGVTLVGDKLQLARASVQFARTSSEGMREILQSAAQQALENRLDELGLDELERRVKNGIDNSEDFLEFARLSAELTEKILVTAGIDDAAALAIENLRLAQARVAAAQERLQEVQHRLGELRRKRDVGDNAKQIAQLALAIVAELDGVQERLDRFQGRLASTLVVLTNWRERTNHWIRWSSTLAVLALIGLGVGQLALAAWGWRWLSLPATQAPESWKPDA